MALHCKPRHVWKTGRTSPGRIPAAGPNRLSAAARAQQATRCLFSDQVLSSPAEALQRAAAAFGFDFARLRQARWRQRAVSGCCAAADADASRAGPQELKLDFYGCIKLINFVRKQVCPFSGYCADGAAA